MIEFHIGSGTEIADAEAVLLSGFLPLNEILDATIAELRAPRSQTKRLSMPYVESGGQNDVTNHAYAL